MTINAISDIHASFDPKTGQVVYNLPLKYERKEYERSFKALYDHLIAHRKDYLKLDVMITDRVRSVSCHNAKDVYKALERVKRVMERGYVGKSQLNYRYIARTTWMMKDIADFVWSNNIRWKSGVKKLKVTSLDEIVDYVGKLGFDFDPSKLKKADYLVIAGDLGLSNFYDKVVEDLERRTKGKFKRILHIAGNHDHWWVEGKGGSESRPKQIDLSHEYCEFEDDGVLFLGCTMWTPVDENHRWSVMRYMNDYRYIPDFSVIDSDRQYEIQSKWLRDRIEANKDKKIVVFTHHQPLEELIDDDYKHSDVNAAYVVTNHSLDDIGKYENVKLWICGHSHGHRELVHDGIRIVRNPIGYRDHYGYRFSEVDPKHWYDNVYRI